MNKLNIDINYEKKIITIDILGTINKSIIEDYIQEINTNIERIKLTNDCLSNWRFNIYMCHMILRKTDLELMKDFINQYKNTFKMIGIIVAKPQKKYKIWFDDMIDKYFSDCHIKTLITNNMFKFNIL